MPDFPAHVCIWIPDGVGERCSVCRVQQEVPDPDEEGQFGHDRDY